MGCASSKQPKRCRHCQNRPYTPVTRSYSMHVHHPPQSENDTYHLVALTSSTLGSLAGAGAFKDSDASDTLTAKKKNSPEELAVGLVEAKTWSAMIDRKIPKIAPMTPVRTPPGEPETINAWELMEGLEDVSPFRSPIHLRSFSFDVVRDPKPESPPDPPKSRFQEKLPDSPPPKPPMCFAAAEERERVVLYFTSLRGVRKTYEECCHVRAALKALGVRVDERDVSMHAGFRDELRRLGGAGGGLPRVFVGEKSIGGADEIRRLIEDGQLEKVLENCERGCDSGELSSGVCEACGDVRFVPCETCSGSCKVYYESEEEEEEEEEDAKEESSEEDYGFQRCPDCNENGLIRCPICCY